MVLVLASEKMGSGIQLCTWFREVPAQQQTV